MPGQTGARANVQLLPVARWLKKYRSSFHDADKTHTTQSHFYWICETNPATLLSHHFLFLCLCHLCVCVCVRLLLLLQCISLIILKTSATFESILMGVTIIPYICHNTQPERGKVASHLLYLLGPRFSGKTLHFCFFLYKEKYVHIVNEFVSLKHKVKVPC